jgi:CRISPR type III-A-associated protein Csm2
MINMAQIGDILEGTVNGEKPYGVFVTLDNGEKGLIHRKQLEAEWPQVGERVRVKVISISAKGIDLALAEENQTGNDSPGEEPQKQGFKSIRQSRFYDEDRKAIWEELFTVYAPGIARDSADISTNQLRNFYDEIKAIQGRIEYDIENRVANFEREKPLIRMIKAKVAHARSRQGDRIPDKFADFLNDCIDSIEDYDDFRAFALVFEAVAGYHTQYSRSKRRSR